MIFLFVYLVSDICFLLVWILVSVLTCEHLKKDVLIFTFQVMYVKKIKLLSPLQQTCMKSTRKQIQTIFIFKTPKIKSQKNWILHCIRLPKIKRPVNTEQAYCSYWKKYVNKKSYYCYFYYSSFDLLFATVIYQVFTWSLR